MALDRQIPDFDLLTGQGAPFAGFGPPLADSAERTERLRHIAKAAKERIKESFGVQFRDSSYWPRQIDEVIDSMWRDGWSPRVGNVNLFATDFGSVIAEAILEQAQGRLIFRSNTDLIQRCKATSGNHHRPIPWAEEGAGNVCGHGGSSSASRLASGLSG